MLKSAIWWTTMACNFKCKYCWELQAQERGEFKSVPFRPAKDWLEVWNRVRPQLLDITGGEPFLMPDFLELLTGLDPTIRVANGVGAKRSPSVSRGVILARMYGCGTYSAHAASPIGIMVGQTNPSITFGARWSAERTRRRAGSLSVTDRMAHNSR